MLGRPSSPTGIAGCCEAANRSDASFAALWGVPGVPLPPARVVDPGLTKVSLKQGNKTLQADGFGIPPEGCRGDQRLLGSVELALSQGLSGLVELLALLRGHGKQEVQIGFAAATRRLGVACLAQRAIDDVVHVQTSSR